MVANARPQVIVIVSAVLPTNFFPEQRPRTIVLEMAGTALCRVPKLPNNKQCRLIPIRSPTCIAHHSVAHKDLTTSPICRVHFRHLCQKKRTKTKTNHTQSSTLRSIVTRDERPIDNELVGIPVEFRHPAQLRLNKSCTKFGVKQTQLRSKTGDCKPTKTT